MQVMPEVCRSWVAPAEEGGGAYLVHVYEAAGSGCVDVLTVPMEGGIVGVKLVYREAVEVTDLQHRRAGKLAIR
jgi:hypothetical protein